MAVSKTFPTSAIRDAYAAGLRVFGENKVQELVLKAGQVLDLGLSWHLVGPLQTNKVNLVLPHMQLLHSLDRTSLVSAIDQRATGSVSALIQVNVTGEPTKSGVSPAILPPLVDAVLGSTHVSVVGLMTIGPLGGDSGAVRGAFRRLSQLRDDLRRRYPGLLLPVLSMGMSNDFEIAVAEGATHLRIGSRVFGSRSYPG